MGWNHKDEFIYFPMDYGPHPFQKTIVLQSVRTVVN